MHPSHKNESNVTPTSVDRQQEADKFCRIPHQAISGLTVNRILAQSQFIILRIIKFWVNQRTYLHIQSKKSTKMLCLVVIIPTICQIELQLQQL